MVIGPKFLKRVSGAAVILLDPDHWLQRVYAIRRIAREGDAPDR